MVFAYGYYAVMTNNEMYMRETEFNDDDPCMMTVEVGPDGVVVESICCNARMSEQTARELHNALSRWIADRNTTRNEDS